MSSSSTPSASLSAPPKLPIKLIPGDYGLPFFGPIKDRYNYFYNQGKDEFFRTRMQNYKSTVFRTNMHPGPFISSSAKVVVVLDSMSFQVLFDTTKVEKRDVLAGTYMPSPAFTGGYRICSYLDPSEPKHASLKRFFLSLLASRHRKLIPSFQSHLSDLFLNVEADISKGGKANFNTLSDDMSFKFVFSLICDQSPPTNSPVASKGSNLVKLWLLPQLAPKITLGFPKLLSCVEDFLLHTFSYPAFVVASTYKKLYDSFHESAAFVLDEAERSFGIPRDEACHNLVFLAGLNACGGMKSLFPGLIRWVGSAGDDLHRKLREEIRAVIKEDDGNVTFSALDKMKLTKSVVYEFLRIDPPVPLQYGKAKKDIMIESHDAAFEIKKGEMICGYQPLATKDPKVFENPEEFVGHRFIGDGEKLLKYVYWSNGREVDDPTVENKQCAGKDLVLLMCRLMLVELFIRYDTYTVDVNITEVGTSVTFKTLAKASS